MTFAVFVACAAALAADLTVATPSSVELTARRPDRPDVLVLRRDVASMDSFVRGMVGELAADFNVAAMMVTRDTPPEALERVLGERKPAVVVVLDNPTAELYRAYQQQFHASPAPPAVIAMALFVEQVSARIRNATGIAYEVPAVTSFGQLRSAVTDPVVRVGVLHRPQFAPFVAEQAELAAIEGFEIVPYEVPQRPGLGQVRKGLKTLDKLDVDALWVLNDNALLNLELLVGAWLPLMRRSERPVVVGVSSLLRTEPPVGSFAVLPDHESLGLQAAELIYQLRDADWEVAEAPLQLPIAVETVLNVPVTERTGGLKPGALDQIDEVIR